MGKYFGARHSEDKTPEEDLENAQRVLAAVRAQSEEVAQLGAALRYHNTGNHYGERLEATMRRAQR